MRRDTKRTNVFTRRALLVAAGQVGLFGLLGARLYRVQVIDGARYATMAKHNSVRVRLIAPLRGRILDRFGTIVAGNRTNWRALLLAEQATSVKATLDRFSRIMPLSVAERARIHRDLRTHRRFIPVLLRDYLDWSEMARIEVNAPYLPGVLVDVGSTRTYPFGAALAHLVGYVAPPRQRDVKADPLLAMPGMRVGRIGVEEEYDPQLRGKAGTEQLEVNAVGRVIRELGRQEGTPGADVTLTLDARLQQYAYDRLAGQSAGAVVLDAQTGEVMAIATRPSFDPSLFNTGVSDLQWRAWMTNARKPLLDKATEGLFAPGSTFKPIVSMAALEAHAITPQTTFFCPGHFDLGKARFFCWDLGGHGRLDLTGALKNSCDVYFYKTALRVGIDRMAAMANRFGLGVDLHMGLPGVFKGFVPTREWRMKQGKPWEPGDTVVHGIGQGYTLVTPLALATQTARLATGRAVLPHVTRAVGGAGRPGASAQDWPMMGVPEADLQVVRHGMWEVVNSPGGTGPLAKLPLPGVQMAGKSGSAEVYHVSRLQREHGYNSANVPWKLRPHALFIGFAPYAAPRYAVSVVVEHGNAGPETAAPIVRDIMVRALTLDPAGRGTPLPQAQTALLGAVPGLLRP